MTIESYKTAQRAVADLKGAILEVLAQCSESGISNASLGRALGIYTGHSSGQEGHISRTLLEMMKNEGVVKQDEKTKTWSIIQY